MGRVVSWDAPLAASTLDQLSRTTYRRAMSMVDLYPRFLQASKADGVLRVVINRPERRNACTIEMYHGIKRAAVLAENDPDIDALVLTGSGDLFCVGGEMGGQHEGGAPIDRETEGIDLLPF